LILYLVTSNVFHIVTFNNPDPPNYGGAIDVYYKLKALYNIGIELHLHIFNCNGNDIADLQSICKQVYTYNKKWTSMFYLFSSLPFSVAIRRNKNLLKNLNTVEAPILFEGLQSTAVLIGNKFQYPIIVRAHNIEHHYYEGLAKSESNVFKKWIYRRQALKMKKYEKILKKSDLILSLSCYEQSYFEEHYQNKCAYIPVFQSNDEVEKLSTKGEYALYHGDLSISDNLRAAQYFITIFKKIDYPLIIAGSKNLEFLEKQSRDYANISITRIENNEHLNELLKGAHINVIISFQKSGTKLKIINALFKSRFCVVNENVVDDPEVVALCEIANTSDEFENTIKTLINKDYDTFEKRQTILKKVYNNHMNAEKIESLIAERS